MAKQGIFTNAVGVTYGDRQNRLAYLSQYKTTDLAIRLEREEGNLFDSNAIKIWVRVPSKKIKVFVGYLSKMIASELAPAMDAGVITLAGTQGIVGGYAGKNYGLRLSVAF
jgi:hypothetical protein